MRYIKLLVLCTSLTWIHVATAQELQRVGPEELGTYWFTDQKISPEYALSSLVLGLEGCYVVQFDITPTGSVENANVQRDDIKLMRRPSRGTYGAAKTKAEEAQRNEVLKAVSAVVYRPAETNPTHTPVRTFTKPIVIAQRVIERPDDPHAVAKVEAAFQKRMDAYYQLCTK